MPDVTAQPTAQAMAEARTHISGIGDPIPHEQGGLASAESETRNGTERDGLSLGPSERR